RLKGIAPVLASPFGHDPQRTPRRNGGGLALEDLLADCLECDRTAGRALRRLADEDRARLGRRLEAARGVDDVAGDHPLVGRAEGDSGLAGEDAAAGLDARTENADGVDELECRPNGTLGIVLLRDRGAPDRHDRVADEL